MAVLARTGGGSAQHPNDLLGRKMLTCHSFISPKRVENGLIRLINLVAVQGSRPELVFGLRPIAEGGMISAT